MLKSEYYLSFQNNINEFQKAVGGIIEGGIMRVRDLQEVPVTFFRMKDNFIHHLNPIAGLFAYMRPKENNQFYIQYIGQTENFPEMKFPPRLEKALSIYHCELFIAIAPNEDESFRQSVVNRLLERHPENIQ